MMNLIKNLIRLLKQDRSMLYEDPVAKNRILDQCLKEIAKTQTEGGK